MRNRFHTRELRPEAGALSRAAEPSRRDTSAAHLPDDLHTQLWMVVSRPGPGRQPWFILTNEPVLTAQTA